MKIPIAKRSVDAVDRTIGIRQSMQFELFAPYPVDNGANYMCIVRIVGRNIETKRIGGVDSMQALSLAIEWLRIHFEEIKKDTYDFYWTDSMNLMDSFDYRIENSANQS